MSIGLPAGVLAWLRHRLVGERPPVVQYECRRCGHTLPAAGPDCPACGAADVARYEL